MTTPPRSKSLTAPPDNPRAAEPAAVRPAVGVPRVVAEGVPTAVHPEPQYGDGRHISGCLTIRAPYGATPTATSWCACGRDLFAIGHNRVLALTEDHTAHRDACPLRTASEGRAAA